MTEKTNKIERPLSPHLQVYRLPLTALLSISHRISGIALILGAIFISIWFIAAVAGEEYYTLLMDFSQGWIGTLMIFGWSVALFYHLCNGIRHLLWDVGVGLNKCGACKGNTIVILATIILTAGIWFYTSENAPDLVDVNAIEITDDEKEEGEE